jgi:DNA-binding response OmpR family regulator
MHLLIVEDDRLLGQALVAGLEQAGFQPDWVRDGLVAWTTVQAEQFSALVLDIGLPRLSGLDLLRRLRQAGSAMPVLLLTARDTPQDIIAGLNAGADDYLIKPFDMGELAARLRAIVRRGAGHAAPILKQGDLYLDPANRIVMRAGESVDLSVREYDLLHLLLLSAGKVKTRAQLEAQLYCWGDAVESNALEVHVHHLRRKLGAELIRTVRGVGYMIPA